MNCWPTKSVRLEEGKVDACTLDVSFLRAQIMSKCNVFSKVGLDFLVMPQYNLSIICKSLVYSLSAGIIL